MPLPFSFVQEYYIMHKAWWHKKDSCKTIFFYYLFVLINCCNLFSINSGFCCCCVSCLWWCAIVLWEKSVCFHHFGAFFFCFVFFVFSFGCSFFFGLRCGSSVNNEVYEALEIRLQWFVACCLRVECVIVGGSTGLFELGEWCVHSRDHNKILRQIHALAFLEIIRNLIRSQVCLSEFMSEILENPDIARPLSFWDGRNVASTKQNNVELKIRKRNKTAWILNLCKWSKKTRHS